MITLTVTEKEAVGIHMMYLTGAFALVGSRKEFVEYAFSMSKFLPNMNHEEQEAMAAKIEKLARDVPEELRTLWGVHMVEMK